MAPPFQTVQMRQRAQRVGLDTDEGADEMQMQTPRPPSAPRTRSKNGLGAHKTGARDKQGRPMTARKLTLKKNPGSRSASAKGKTRPQTQRTSGEEAGEIDWNEGDGDLGSIYEEMQAVQRELRNVISTRAVSRLPMGRKAEHDAAEYNKPTGFEEQSRIIAEDISPGASRQENRSDSKFGTGGGAGSSLIAEFMPPIRTMTPRSGKDTSKGEYYLSEEGSDPYGGLGYGSDKELEDDYELIPEDGEDPEMTELEPDMEFFRTQPKEFIHPSAVPITHHLNKKKKKKTPVRRAFYDAYGNLQSFSKQDGGAPKRKTGRPSTAPSRRRDNVYPTKRVVQSSGYGKVTTVKKHSAKANLKYLHRLHQEHSKKYEKIECMRQVEEQHAATLGYNKKTMRPAEAEKAFARISSYYDDASVFKKLQDEEAKGKALTAGEMERTLTLNKAIVEELGAIDERHAIWKAMMEKNDAKNRARMASLEAAEENSVRKRDIAKYNANTRLDIVRKHQHRRFLTKELERVDDGGKLEHRWTNPPKDIYVEGIPGMSKSGLIPPKTSIATDNRRTKASGVESIRAKEARWDQIVVPHSPYEKIRKEFSEMGEESYVPVTPPRHRSREIAPWRTKLNLKDESVQVYARLLEGNDEESTTALSEHESLEITQRLHMDQGTLQALALTCTQSSCGSQEETEGLTVLYSGDDLQEGIIPYLLSRDAMGVAVTRTGAKVHVVPPCAFTLAHLAGLAPEILAELQRGAGGAINPQCYLLGLVTLARNYSVTDGLLAQSQFLESPGSSGNEGNFSGKVDPATQIVATPPASMVAKGIASPRPISPLYSAGGIFPRPTEVKTHCDYCAQFNVGTVQTCRYCCRQPNPPFTGP